MTALALQNYPTSATLDTVENTLQDSAKVDWQSAQDLQDYTCRTALSKYLRDNNIWPGRRRRRLEACGHPFDYRSPICKTTATYRHFCHLYRVCPTCARIRRKRQVEAIKALLPTVKKVVEDMPNVAYQGEFLDKPLSKPPIVAILEDLATLSKLEGISVPTYGQVGGVKEELKARLNDLIYRIQGLEQVRVAEAIKALRAARTALRQRFCRRAWVNRLRVPQRVLADNLDYRWRLITLTIATNGEYDQAVEKISKAFGKLYRKLLKAPGTAAQRSIEFGPKNGNVHIHCLYFGPYVKANVLREVWCELTGGSYVADLKEVGKDGELDTAIKEATKYITKFTESEPAKIVEYERALYKRHSLQRYGSFRQKKDNTNTGREPVIVNRLPRYKSDQSGGWRVEFERPMRCPCGCGERMELAQRQPFLPSALNALARLGRPQALVPGGGAPLQRSVGRSELASDMHDTAIR